MSIKVIYIFKTLLFLITPNPLVKIKQTNNIFLVPIFRHDLINLSFLVLVLFLLRIIEISIINYYKK